MAISKPSLSGIISSRARAELLRNFCVPGRFGYGCLEVGAGRRMGLYPRAASCGRGARHVCCGHYFHMPKFYFPTQCFENMCFSTSSEANELRPVTLPT